MIFLQLFWTFFKIGAFTFGGGYAMIPLIQSEVESHGWMTQTDLINFIAISESTPGPLAINISTYVGTEVGGFIGAMCATLGVSLPSFVVILIVARIYEKFKNSRIVTGCMSGLKPCVIGLIAAAIISVGHTVFFPNGISTDYILTYSFISTLFIFALMTFLVFKKCHPIFIIILSAVLGIIAGYAGELLHL